MLHNGVKSENPQSPLTSFYILSMYTKQKIHPGLNGGGATPVPIPNTAVKPSSADGTTVLMPWESRTRPGFFIWIRCCVERSKTFWAGVIQLVECQLPKLDVAGSSPVARSLLNTSY